MKVEEEIIHILAGKMQPMTTREISEELPHRSYDVAKVVIYRMLSRKGKRNIRRTAQGKVTFNIKGTEKGTKEQKRNKNNLPKSSTRKACLNFVQSNTSLNHPLNTREAFQHLQFLECYFDEGWSQARISKRLKVVKSYISYIIDVLLDRKVIRATRWPGIYEKMNGNYRKYLRECRKMSGQLTLDQFLEASGRKEPASQSGKGLNEFRSVTGPPIPVQSILTDPAQPINLDEYKGIHRLKRIRLHKRIWRSSILGDRSMPEKMKGRTWTPWGHMEQLMVKIPVKIRGQEGDLIVVFFRHSNTPDTLSKTVKIYYPDIYFMGFHEDKECEEIIEHDVTACWNFMSRNWDLQLTPPIQTTQSEAAIENHPDAHLMQSNYVKVTLKNGDVVWWDKSKGKEVEGMSKDDAETVKLLLVLAHPAIEFKEMQQKMDRLERMMERSGEDRTTMIQIMERLTKLPSTDQTPEAPESDGQEVL